MIMLVSEDMLQTLIEVRDLLLKHDFPGQASFVARLVGMAEEGNDAFAVEVAGGAMWGGAGAVWEVGTFKGHKIADAEAGKDEAVFRKAIIRLAEGMDQADIGTSRSRDIAGMLRYWQKKGL